MEAPHVPEPSTASIVAITAEHLALAAWRNSRAVLTQARQFPLGRSLVGFRSPLWPVGMLPQTGQRASPRMSLLGGSAPRRRKLSLAAIFTVAALALVLLFATGPAGPLSRLRSSPSSPSQEGSTAAAQGSSTQPPPQERTPQEGASVQLLGEGDTGEGSKGEAGDETTGGWANSYLKRKANQTLTKLIDSTSYVSPLRLCPSDSFSWAEVPAKAMAAVMEKQDAGKDAVAVTAHNLPCGKKASSGGSCCDHPLHMRPGTTDWQVFRQVFQCHYMRYLYTLFERDSPPKYILDAGANVGFSTVLFKLMWPEATVVSLEPDPQNFALLERNTQTLKNVHALQAGLWGRKANITVLANHGEWGRVFQEAEEGMPAYSVSDVATMYNIPAFDFVKIDIEGAEGMVFEPGVNLTWMSHTRAVSLEIHDFFAKYFKLSQNEMSSRIDAAFNQTGYSIVSDNEHIMYLAPSLTASLAAQQLPSERELRQAHAKHRKLDRC